MSHVQLRKIGLRRCLTMGKVYVQSWITRKDLQNNPNVMYLFGDNMVRKGFGGQAKEMRGEPNAVGIPTKINPGMNEFDYFSDDMFASVKNVLDSSFLPVIRHLQGGGMVVIPADGLGTGLSEMPARCPKCYDYLCAFLKSIKDLDC
jgi:hypothetical protein